MDEILISQLISIDDEPAVRHSLRLKLGDDDDDEMTVLYCETAEEKERLELALRVAWKS